MLRPRGQPTGQPRQANRGRRVRRRHRRRAAGCWGRTHPRGRRRGGRSRVAGLFELGSPRGRGSDAREPVGRSSAVGDALVDTSASSADAPVERALVHGQCVVKLTETLADRRCGSCRVRDPARGHRRGTWDRGREQPCTVGIGTVLDDAGNCRPSVRPGKTFHLAGEVDLWSASGDPLGIPRSRTPVFDAERQATEHIAPHWSDRAAASEGSNHNGDGNGAGRDLRQDRTAHEITVLHLEDQAIADPARS
jgi:hypothetical protein